MQAYLESLSDIVHESTSETATQSNDNILNSGSQVACIELYQCDTTPLFETVPTTSNLSERGSSTTEAFETTETATMQASTNLDIGYADGFTASETTLTMEEWGATTIISAQEVSDLTKSAKLHDLSETTSRDMQTSTIATAVTQTIPESTVVLPTSNLSATVAVLETKFATTSEIPLSSATLKTTSVTTYLPKSTSSTSSFKAESTPACPPQQFYTCGTCFRYDLRDCRGICPNLMQETDYRKDCSGKCVPITTAQKLDICGVCGGDGKSCLDCQGVPFGRSRYDFCGVCNGNGTSCSMIWHHLEPSVIPNRGEALVDLYGAGLTQYGSRVALYTNESVPLLISPLKIVSLEAGRMRVRVNKTVSISAATTFLIKVTSFRNASFPIILFPTDLAFLGVSSLTLYSSPVQNRINITSALFLREYPARCLFSVPDLMLVPMVVVDSNNAFCVTPMIPRSVAMNMSISYDLPQNVTAWRSDLLILGPGGNSNVTFKVFAAAPIVESCVFSNDGGSINIKFSKPVKVLRVGSASQVTLDCASFINFNSVPVAASLGASGCMFYLSSPDVITIVISTQMSQKPEIGATVYFAAGKFLADGELFSDAVSSSARISAPANPVVPSIVLLNPTEISSCQNLVLDFSRTSNSGGRPFTAGRIDFIVSTGSPTEKQVLKTALDSAFAVALAGNQTLMIASNILWVGTFTFSLTLTNFLGGIGLAETTVSKAASDMVANLQINGPSGPVKADASITLEAVFKRGCGKAASLTPSFQWSFYEGPQDFTFWIDPSLANHDSITFAPNTFPGGGNFKFYLSVSLSSDDFQLFEYSFATLPSLLQVPTVLGNVSATVDTARIPAVYTLGASVLPSDTSIRWTCFHDQDLCAGTEALFRQFILDMTTFDVGVYLLSYEIRLITGESAFSPIFEVALLREVSPAISLKLSSENVSPWSADFHVSSTITLTDQTLRMSDISFAWFSLPYCNNQASITVSFNTSNVLAAGPGVLKFAPGYLIPGGQYCIGLNVWEPGGKTPGNSTISFTVLNGPRSGTCFATSRTVGKAFTSLFMFQCSGWVTDQVSMPLIYTWEIKSPLSKVWTTVLQGSNPLFQSVFPIGQYMVRATVSDQAEGKNLVPQQIPISVIGYASKKRGIDRRASNQVGPLEYFDTTVLPNYTNFSSTASVLRDCSVLSQLITLSTTSNLVKVGLQLRLSLMMQELSRSGLFLDFQTNAPILISVLSNVAGEPTMTDTTLQIYVLESTAAIVEALLSNWQTGICIATPDAISIVSIISAALKDSSKSELNTLVAKTLTSLDQCVQNSLVCGEPPLIAANSVYKEVGVASLKDNTLLCNGSIQLQYSSTAPDGCASYQCNHLLNVIKVSPESRIALVDAAWDLTLKMNDSSFETEPATIRIKLYPSAEFSVKAQALTQDSKYSLACVWAESNENFPASNSLDTGACDLLSATSSETLCSCRRLGSVALAVVHSSSNAGSPIPSLSGLTPLYGTVSTSTLWPSSSTTQVNTVMTSTAGSSENLALIIGCSIAGILAIAGLIQAAVWKARQQSKQVAPLTLDDIQMLNSEDEDSDEEGGEKSKKGQSLEDDSSIMTRISASSSMTTVHIPPPPPPDPSSISQKNMSQELLHSLSEGLSKQSVNPNTLSRQSLLLKEGFDDPNAESALEGGNEPIESRSGGRKRLVSAPAFSWPFQV
ncbi:hypothetical protein CcCBS67573_g06673 [Chytriomyces confervae]|uniref:GPS domain-containing protein n=1 Tax=Chytriomyces confervae TaxID=246404 RepID=A0A507F3W0_9FUNG|nr:hypothetical protein CcCBS67573_g06673 [Chytriomyces confervae]